MEAQLKESRAIGRPKEYGERKTFTISLPPETVSWLDRIARESGMSRNRMIALQLHMISLLSATGHIVFNDEEPGSMSFRPIANPKVFREQIETGIALRMLDSLPLNSWTLRPATRSEREEGSVGSELEFVRCDD